MAFAETAFAVAASRLRLLVARLREKRLARHPVEIQAGPN
jgi:hypothetical protein